MRSLAVIPVATCVLRTELLQLHQDRDETFRAFTARVRGKAHSALSTQCECGKTVDYTDHIIRDVLLNGIDGTEIRREVLGTKDILQKAVNDVIDSVYRYIDQFGISDIELRWFESYLNNREQVCIVNNLMSSSKRIVSGVPQGSILGSLLFLLYINDLPDCLRKTSPYLYADDTQICCSSNSMIELTENLNHDLSRIGDWLSRNKLQHHPTKTKIMFIGSKHHINSTTFDHPVMLNNQRIPRVHSFTCLGLDLDENLNWNSHIQAICKKVGAGLGTLRRI